MLILNLGQQDIILGRKWFKKLDIWLDIKNRRLIWPEGRCLDDCEELRHERIIKKRDLVDLKPNPAYQADADRRDKAFREEERRYG